MLLWLPAMRPPPPPFAVPATAGAAPTSHGTVVWQNCKRERERGRERLSEVHFLLLLRFLLRKHTEYVGGRWPDRANHLTACEITNRRSNNFPKCHPGRPMKLKPKRDLAYCWLSFPHSPSIPLSLSLSVYCVATVRQAGTKLNWLTANWGIICKRSQRNAVSAHLGDLIGLRSTLTHTHTSTLMFAGINLIDEYL